MLSKRDTRRCVAALSPQCPAKPQRATQDSLVTFHYPFSNIDISSSRRRQHINHLLWVPEKCSSTLFRSDRTCCPSIFRYAHSCQPQVFKARCLISILSSARSLCANSLSSLVVTLPRGWLRSIRFSNRNLRRSLGRSNDSAFLLLPHALTLLALRSRLRLSLGLKLHLLLGTSILRYRSNVGIFLFLSVFTSLIVTGTLAPDHGLKTSADRGRTFTSPPDVGSSVQCIFSTT